MITLDLLRDVDLFALLSPDELARVAALAREETLRKDQLVFRERDPGDRLYVVLSGVVEIGRPRPDGKFMRLASLERGEVFGELSMLDEGARSASAVAAIVPETRIAGWSVADLRALFDKEPALAAKIHRALARKLATRLRATSDAVFTLVRGLGPPR